jgi:hypothetical protein
MTSCSAGCSTSCDEATSDTNLEGVNQLIMLDLAEDRSCLTELKATPVPLNSKMRGVRVEHNRAQVDREKYITVRILQDTPSLLLVV